MMEGIIGILGVGIGAVIFVFAYVYFMEWLDKILKKL